MKRTFKLMNLRNGAEIKKTLIKCNKIEAYKSREQFPYTMYKIKDDIMTGYAPNGIRTIYAIKR